jgi:hypothetical protein
MSALTVIFICRGCAIVYRATQQKLPHMTAGRFDCVDCETPVYKWSGRYNYTGWCYDRKRQPVEFGLKVKK